MLKVQRKPCSTCIFRPDSSLNLKHLLDAVRETPPPNWPKDQVWDHFKGYRICHHSEDAVCAGFWARCKDKFALGQVSQRMGMVQFVDDDNQKGEGEMSNKHGVKRERRLARQRGGAIVRNGVTLQRGVAPRYEGVSDEDMLRSIRLKREQAMREAIDAANGRLEPKQHSLPLATTWSQPNTATRPVPTPQNGSPRRSATTYVAPKAEADLPIQVEEAELLAGISEAMAAGRSEIDAAALSHLLLTGPSQVGWRGQRSFLKGKGL